METITTACLNVCASAIQQIEAISCMPNSDVNVLQLFYIRRIYIIYTTSWKSFLIWLVLILMELICLWRPIKMALVSAKKKNNRFNK